MSRNGCVEKLLHFKVFTLNFVRGVQDAEAVGRNQQSVQTAAEVELIIQARRAICMRETASFTVSAQPHNAGMFH